MRSLVLAVLAVLGASVVQAQAPMLTKTWTVGCESCTGVEQFTSIWDVAVAPNGDVLVTDKAEPMLRRFDASGKLTWSGGRKGKGPGEYVAPMRTLIGAGGMSIVDMTNARITNLDSKGALVGSTPILSGFPTTAGTDARGDILLGLDDFGRSFRLAIKSPGAADMRQIVSLPGSMKNKSIALAADGLMAVALDNQSYSIRRLRPDGTALDSIVRDLPRPRRSDQEEAEFRKRLSGEMAAMSAEMSKQGKTGTAKAPTLPPEERGLKPHINSDGLRYDDAGRLWVHTMRGDESRTLFDVFSPAGALLGTVTIPMRVSAFALAGRWMATAAENEDGIPVVTLWAVK